MTVDEVKKELRELRHIEKCIRVRETIRDIRERRLKWLRSQPESDEISEEIHEVTEILKSLKINDHIKRATRLEKKYMDAISTLAPDDQIIVFECFVKGEKTYFQVGNDIGYSEEWVKVRVRRIMENLAKRIKTPSGREPAPEVTEGASV